MLKCIVLAGIVGLLAVSSTRAGAPLGLDTKGLYLRADVGLIFQKDDQAFLLDASEERDEQNVSFDSGTVFALGVGYHFNSSLRSDIVLSHQPKRDDRDQYFNGGRAVDNIPNAWWTSALTSQTLMANVYFEPLKMNFKKFAPYVFGGLGLARHKLDGFSISAPSTTTTVLSGATNTDMAWRVGAGISYPLTQNLTLDLSYSYVDLGEAETSRTIEDTSLEVVTPFRTDIQTHGVMLGVRYKF